MHARGLCLRREARGSAPRGHGGPSPEVRQTGFPRARGVGPGS
jgi:hypothetical protein